ncbi:hypothetical protein [Paracoccus lutimaris]|uniref:Oxidoreductase N-terminal domain-containing protein n=1 Tax=Paracoccus lutimaris TaxID=1490030 RepID=A0A368Z3Z0_9RHOB|nr:hypothetical protein [Paracoccus lutimaris]RCW87173.1 hypothetical protein DFP89_103177 [Paracoccus lutimaris]
MLKRVEQDTNRRIVLNSRPVGAIKEADYRLETAEIAQPEPGQMLVCNHSGSKT